VIYVFGGWDGEKYQASGEKYDNCSNKWVQVKSMTTARCTHVCVKSPDNTAIIVLGGYNGKALNYAEK
jgi:N-acetylneuraminic acid mutarotase